jgi:TetR/AcrR family transcriptional regulator, cholesterol catabolism regulator
MQFCILIIIMKQQIIEKSLIAFMQRGFKAVTVDEIAALNNISKKTLYELFKDKDAIVCEAVSAFNCNLEEHQLEIIRSSQNAVEEVALIMQMIENKLKQMNINCFMDLQKYYPQALNNFAQNKQVHIEMLLANIKRGVKEGLYRKNLSIELIANLRMETMFHFLTTPTAMNRFSFVEMQLHQIQLFLYGICTIKGHELIDKYIVQLKKKSK